MYLVRLGKILCGILLAAIGLAGCSYGEYHSCTEVNTTEHYLDSVTRNKMQVIMQKQYTFVYAKDSIPRDTIPLIKAGSTKETLSLKADYYDYCRDEIKDYLEGTASHFLENAGKKNSLIVYLWPAYVEYYNPSPYYSRYSLNSSTGGLEIKWGNYLFKTSIVALETTNNNPLFYASINLGGKTFTNVYKVVLNDSTNVFMNRSSIAQIRVGKETWTNIE